MEKSLQGPDVLLAMKIAVRVSEAAITGKDYLLIIQEMLDIVTGVYIFQNSTPQGGGKCRRKSK